MYLEKAPVKAKTITARPPPADTNQSQKKIFLWQKNIFHGAFFLPKVFKLFTKCTLPYLKSSKLADVSEHLVVVKIPPPHPHWEAFPGPVKKNSLMLKKRCFHVAHPFLALKRKLLLTRSELLSHEMKYAVESLKTQRSSNACNAIASEVCEQRRASALTVD